MRGIRPVMFAASAACTLMLSSGGPAFSQTTAPASTGAAASPPLSAEDQNASPFPPGQNAALVKQVCTACHSPNLILEQRFGQEDAERYYKNMVSKDITTDQAQKIIKYLTTTLGQ